MLNVTKFHSFLQNVLLQSVRVEVDIVDLFDFAQESTRNWKEGNEIFKNNHVIVVGVTKVAGESIHIFCSCLRGSNPSEPPREIRMVTSSELRNWEISCSCPAGKFRCKHQFACLLFIHRYIKRFEFREIMLLHMFCSLITEIRILKYYLQQMCVNSGVK